MICRAKMVIYILLLALACVCSTACNREGVPPFTVTVTNPHDFDLLVIGNWPNCGYEDAADNLDCILPSGAKRLYATYGPGRPFLVNVYKAGTEYMVGWVNFVGQSGRQYSWTVGFDQPVLEIK